jgi:hypothetical protein
MKKSSLLDHSKFTPEELEKFKEIVHKDYGRELSDAQAIEQATALLNFFDYFIDKRHKEKRFPQIKSS